ncbi:MAG: thioredoxin family protein [Pirellulales bacterium]|nr:thioredoxin family protein [Pirellulales bacterium]
MARLLGAEATADLPGFAGLPSGPSKEIVVSVKARFTAPTARQAGQLSITARIKSPWHIYSITQPPGGPLPTEIKLPSSGGFHILEDFIASPPPEKKSEPAFDGLVIETHHDQVVWRAPIEIDSHIDPKTLKIEGTVRIQPCNPNQCLPPREVPFTAVFERITPPPAEAQPAGTPGDSAAPQAAERQVLEVRQTAVGLKKLEIVHDHDLQRTSLVLIIGLGFLGGLILNLMPCVLPVIGLKIMSFVHQSGQSRRRALALNVWYSLGLLSVFVVLATLSVLPKIGLGWGQLFSFTGFNVALAAVVFAMSLSLLGIWEIPIPGFLGAGRANDLSQREGAAGAFCKGVITTILATPCSGPFLASALAWTVGQPPLKAYAVFLSAGFGMASPYLLIGLFPGLIRFLPKPGLWMETFKQVMGFVLLGTVVYLLTLIPWIFIVPTVAFLFGLWAACWWIGRSPPTSDFRQKARAWFSAAAFAGVTWFVTFGWLAEVMAGRFERALHTAYGHSVGDFAGQDENQLPWRPFTHEGLEKLIAAEKTVMVDFTADWCLTCKTLEKLVLNTRETCSAVRRNGVATLRADWTRASPEVTEMLELLGSKQVPVIAIFPAGSAYRPIVLRGGYTQEMLLGALEKAGPSKSLRVTAAQARPTPKRTDRLK